MSNCSVSVQDGGRRRGRKLSRRAKKNSRKGRRMRRHRGGDGDSPYLDPNAVPLAPVAVAAAPVAVAAAPVDSTSTTMDDVNKYGNRAKDAAKDGIQQVTDQFKSWFSSPPETPSLMGQQGGNAPMPYTSNRMTYGEVGTQGGSRTRKHRRKRGRHSVSKKRRGRSSKRRGRK